MRILGLSAFYHDSAAALLVDGEIIAAAQEERFTRIKHDEAFPTNAVEYCLREAGIGGGDIDHVVFYDKPLLKFERIIETYVAHAPLGFSNFKVAMPTWIKQRLKLKRAIAEGVGPAYTGKIAFTEHHESHAASAFFPSPFEEAAILTIDGVGEWATSTIGRGSSNQMELLKEMRFPHSLGLLYTAFTYYCGFKVNSGEYKLMGLAPYGEPRYAEHISNELMDLKPDGSLRLDMRYFGYCRSLKMITRAFEKLFGQPARKPESELTQFYKDIAASVQAVTEDIVLRLADTAHALTDSKNLCLAGGVALNCVANGRLLRESKFDNIWIQPAAGDAGGALGAAWFVWHQLLKNPRNRDGSADAQGGSRLGPAFDGAETESALREAGVVFHRDEDICRTTAKLLADQKVVGWFQGRMEFGPRALGSRSILGDPRSDTMQKVVNLKIKFRESFRPFAPIVRKEKIADYFEFAPGTESPYMLLVGQVKKDATLPAITHVDESARVQTIDRDRDERLHALLEAFESETGCGVLINTSFNVRGEPIVCTPADAVRCFLATEMDALVVGDFVMLKSEQPEHLLAVREEHLGRFALD